MPNLPSQLDPLESGDGSEIRVVSDFVILAGALQRKSLVVAGGDRASDLLLVEAAQDHGIVDRVILVGDERRIRDAIEQTHVAVAPGDIVAATDDRDTAAKTRQCAQSGCADIIIKGSIPTSVLYRELLTIQRRSTISVVTCFDAAPVADGRVMLLTDPAITVLCTYRRMVDIIENAAEVARLVLARTRPKVAILSASEEEIRSLPSSRMAEALTRRRWEDLDVYGPLSLDLAVDPQSVVLKRLTERFPESRKVAGGADILVFTGIDAANATYKAIMEMAGYGIAGIANITVGLQVPVAPVSRAEPLGCRLASLALTSIYAQRRSAEESSKQAPTVSVPPRPAYRVLVVNPGSTSTKLAFYEGERELCAGEVRFESPDHKCDTTLQDELRSRLELVHRFLQDHRVTDLDAVVGRGGLLPRGRRKLESGVYEVARIANGAVVVDQALVEAVSRQAELDHPSNLGIPLAAELARALRIPAFTADPVCVDEYRPEAEISGYAPVRRRSRAHALSVKEAARRAADELGRRLEHINLVVAHLGGGITVAALSNSRMSDATISLLGDGPFSPQRAGRLPINDVIELAYSGRFTRAQLQRELSTRGGLRSYLGTHDIEQIEQRIANGDEEARLVVDSMIYWIAKEIGAFAAALKGEVEAVVLTGGMAQSNRIAQRLRDRVEHLAPVLVFPGSLEMQAMAAAAGRALAGEEPIRKWADYAPEVA